MSKVKSVLVPLLLLISLLNASFAADATEQTAESLDPSDPVAGSSGIVLSEDEAAVTATTATTLSSKYPSETTLPFSALARISMDDETNKVMTVTVYSLQIIILKY
jgi:hypothetical protein